ncbi:uncharacterized protein PAC_00876 [Phialocephala subalpina]|uniref:Uncharacterized protein n=1 Tax=Phialocephala subalpina TaxID=576137 RepID=A0A1L7WE11_9HELO|nr:uncharacterized protein PAC_00876 [Phialocephala subalpina]
MAHKRKYDDIGHEAEFPIAETKIGFGSRLEILDSEAEGSENEDNHPMTGFPTMAHMLHQTGVEAECALATDGMGSGSNLDTVGSVEGDCPDNATIANTDDGTHNDEESRGSTLGSMDEDHTNSDANIEHEQAVTQVPSPVSSTSGHDFEGNAPAFTQGTKLSFIELQRQCHKILRGALNYTPMCFSSQQALSDPRITALMNKIQELEETKKQIELEIESCEHGIEVARKQRIDHQVKSLLENNGISPELMAEYDAFLASIEPEGGQRGGFSITCFGDHENKYVEYDPSLAILKENAEDDCSVCHYRCEASKVNGPWVVGESCIPEPTRESVVEFWPVDAPVPRARDVRTWGEQFPRLYELAMSAGSAGSEVALQMLVALPDKDSSFRGGWLFDYRFEPALKHHPILSKRWRFRGSYKIDKPVSAQEKRVKLEPMLRI